MHRRCASYILMLDEQSSQAQNVLHTFVCLTRLRRARHKVLHKNAFSDEALFRFTPQYEASSFHSDMKHSAHAPYDLSSIALRATDDEKMKNESWVCKYSLPMLHYSVERKNLIEKTSNKLVDLSIAFAVEILNLVKYLKEQRETIICNQIGRAGTSIGANIHEAQYAHGKADFVSKLQIALKEANETSYWLLLLSKTNIISSAEYDRLETLCREIRITLIASINTTKQNLK